MQQSILNSGRIVRITTLVAVLATATGCFASDNEEVLPDAATPASIAIEVKVGKIPLPPTNVVVSDSDHTDVLRVISANMAHLEFMEDGQPRFIETNINTSLFIESQARYLKSSALDTPNAENVFALQEVDKGADNTGNIDWTHRLNVILGPDYDRYFAKWGFYGTGNLVMMNLRSPSEEKWVLGDSCRGDSERPAQVVHIVEGNVDAWVVDVHLKFCTEVDGIDTFEENLCNLNNLTSSLDNLIETLNQESSEAIIVVAGDFNIHRNPNTDSDKPCFGDSFHPKRYQYMRSEFQRRGFLYMSEGGVDHIFVRDSKYKLKGVTTRTLNPRMQISPSGPYYKVSDHNFKQVDLKLTGSGMSPLFVPIFIAAVY